MKEQIQKRIQLNLPILPTDISAKVVGIHDEVVRLLAEIILLAADEIQRKGGADETK